MVIGGSRRLLEVTETPLPGGGTIGFALDRTDLENAESELARHINAHGQVLESIHAAVAIYGADKRLSFFNSAFARLWGIEEDWLAGEPSLDELLERLRERRRIPEYADFRAFKRQQLGMFTSLIEPLHELMHLPDDAHAQRVGVAASARRADLRVRGRHRPAGARTLVQHADRGAARDARQSVRGHRGIRQRRPAQTAQPGLSQDLGLVRSRISTASRIIADIVEKIRGISTMRHGDWPALRDEVIARITAQAPSERSGRPQRRLGVADWRRCRCPTATCC